MKNRKQRKPKKPVKQPKTRGFGSMAIRDWKPAFLESLRKTPCIKLAVDTAGITYSTAYDRRNRHPEFRKAWDEALMHGIRSMEAIAIKRATIGVAKPIWMKNENGKPVKVDTVYEPSDTLLIFLLKAHDPAKYRDTYNMRVSDANAKSLPPQIIAPIVQFVLPKKQEDKTPVQPLIELPAKTEEPV